MRLLLCVLPIISLFQISTLVTAETTPTSTHRRFLQEEEKEEVGDQIIQLVADTTKYEYDGLLVNVGNNDTNTTNTTTASPTTATPGNHTNVTTTAPTITPGNHTNSTNTTAPTIAPTIAPTPSSSNHTNTTNTTAPTSAPTLPPTNPTKSPTAAPHKKYTPSDDNDDDNKKHNDKKDDKKKKKKSFLHKFFSFIGWMILIGISIITFGLCMQNRTQIYFFLLGLMHTIKEACETFTFRTSLVCASIGRSIRNLHIMDRIYDVWGRIRGLAGGSSGGGGGTNRSSYGNEEDGSMLQGLLLRENA